MKTAHTDLANLTLLAQLLDRLDHSAARVDAAQYRTLAARLAQQLADAEPGAALERLLQGVPALADLYENQHYAEAGLCRSPLEAAAQSELAARELIARARRPEAGAAS